MATRGENMRRLHALGQRLHLAHDDLRRACGVDSLTALSDEQLAAACTRLQRSLPERPFRGGLPRRRPQPGTIRPASALQRRKLADQIAQLGGRAAPRVAQVLDHCGIRDVAEGVFTTAAASAAITQFTQILRALDRGRAREGANG